MSKHKIGLRLKDMYAIKHALQSQIKIKKGKVEELSKINTLDDSCKEKCYEFEMDRLKKDINHEEWLLQSITNEIEEYKANNSIK